MQMDLGAVGFLEMRWSVVLAPSAHCCSWMLRLHSQFPSSNLSILHTHKFPQLGRAKCALWQKPPSLCVLFFHHCNEQLCFEQKLDVARFLTCDLVSRAKPAVKKYYLIPPPWSSQQQDINGKGTIEFQGLQWFFACLPQLSLWKQKQILFVAPGGAPSHE